MAPTLDGDPLELTEASDNAVDRELSAKDVEALESRDDLDVRRATDGSLVINPGRQIGVIGLPSDTVIEIRPQVEFNLLYYLAYTGRIDEELAMGTEVGVSPGESFVDLLGQLLVAEIDQILRRGLHQEYREMRGEERYLRGRLDMTAQIAANGPLASRMICEYDELTHDLPINHVLVQAIDALLPLVREKQLESDIRLTRERLRQYLDQPESIAIDPSEIRLTRQNDHYEPALLLCELILNRTFIEKLGSGVQDFQSLLISTEDLFEQVTFRAVANNVRRDRYRVGGDGDPENKARSDIGYLLRSSSTDDPLQQLRPDIFLEDRSAGECVLIGDAKWKTPTDGGRPSREDLYQLTAYQAKVDASVLMIYPDLNGAVEHTYDYERRGSADSPTLRVMELQTSGASTYDGFKHRIESEIKEELENLSLR